MATNEALTDAEKAQLNEDAALVMGFTHTPKGGWMRARVLGKCSGFWSNAVPNLCGDRTSFHFLLEWLIKNGCYFSFAMVSYDEFVGETWEDVYNRETTTVQFKGPSPGEVLARVVIHCGKE